MTVEGTTGATGVTVGIGIGVEIGVGVGSGVGVSVGPRLRVLLTGVPGGTGKSFDWELIPPAVRTRIVLAGGLNPNNVGQAIELLHPFAVDVSGGVEQASGVKDAGKVRNFVQAVREADQQIAE